MKFKDLLRETLDIYYQSSPSWRTIYSTSQELEQLIGDEPISSINSKVIQSIRNTLNKRGNAAATINRKLSLLSKCLTHAQEEEYITGKPKIRLTKPDNEKLRFLSDTEIDLILSYFEGTTLEYLTIFALNTGMRISEILTLKSAEIDSNYLRIWDTKNNKPRSIPMNDKVKDIIQRLQPELFTTLRYDQVRYQWDKMREATGLTDVTIHTLRHTFCSRLVQKGVDLYLVQKLAGHKNIMITQRYAHLRDEDLEKAVAVL